MNNFLKRVKKITTQRGGEMFSEEEACEVVWFLENYLLEYQLWQFYAVMDDRTCDICKRWHLRIIEVPEDNPEEILPRLFPFGRFINRTTFAPELHPNCRCRIKRMYRGERVRVLDYINKMQNLTNKPYPVKR